MMFSILHVSDLHRDPSHPVTNAALLDSLVRDRDRYSRDEEPRIKPPDLVLVSGDVISGSKATGATARDEISRQYIEAERFLSDLAGAFVGGDRSKIIIVPGNHDVSNCEVQDSLREVPIETRDATTRELIGANVGKLFAPNSNLRWSWQTLSFYEIADPSKYLERMRAFSDFYRDFYRGARTYGLVPEEQYDIFDYPEFGITFAAFNSCYNNDPLNRLARINPDCIASASSALRDTRFRERLRLAVWHHSTNGAPADVDYVGQDVLQVLIDCRFSIGFHGHQHKFEFIDERFKFGSNQGITVICAGTLCGGRDALPAGQPRSYNVIEIDPSALTGRLHIRQMVNETLDSPIWSAGHISLSRRSFIDFRVQPAPTVGPGEVATILADAERHLRGNRAAQAVDLTLPYARDNDLARRLLLEGLMQLNRTKELIERFYPPSSTTECIYVADALLAEGELTKLRDLLNSSSVRDSTDPAVVAMRGKYAKRVR